MFHNNKTTMILQSLCATGTKSKRVATAVLALILWTPATSRAQSEKQLTLFVDSTSLASLKIDTQSVDFDKLPVRLANVSPALNERIGKLLKSAQGATLFLTASIPQSSEGPELRLIAPAAIAQGDLKQHPFLANLRLEKLNETFLAFSSNTKSQAPKRFPIAAVDRLAWEKGAASTGAAPVQLVVVLPEYLRSALVELQSRLPESIGSIPSSVVSDGLLWISVGYVPKNAEATITIQSKSDQAAKALVEALPRVLAASSKLKSPYRDLAGILARKLESAQPNISDSQIKFPITFSEGDKSSEMLTAMLMSTFGNFSNVEKQNKLKAIMLAIHNFESAYKNLPPFKEYRNKDGSSKLSWRVHLLPFIGEVALFQKFRLDEAWDSPHNKPLLDPLPDCYRMSAFQEWTEVLPAGYTTILAPSGKDTALGSNEVVTFSKIEDGTSNTVFLVEVKPDRAVPWTKPQDYDYDPKNPLAGILLDADGKFVVGIGDGSARLIDGNLPTESYDYMFRRSDGHPVTW